MDPAPTPSPHRILVHGVTGSGKSTLARRIGELLDLAVHDVDEMAWEPGWVQVPDDVVRSQIVQICAGPRWVLDTAYGGWREVPLAAADLVVGLDLPRYVALSRLLLRTGRRLARRTQIRDGNVETLGTVFARDSIVVWHFQSFSDERRRMREWASAPNRPRVVLLRDQRAVEAWLGPLSSGSSRP